MSINIVNANSEGYISILRNICISHMKGDVIVFWDSDVFASTNDALSLAIEKLGSNSDIGAVGYNYERDTPSFYEKLLRLRAELGGMGFTAIKRSIFDIIGVFNEKLRVNEDTEFLSRLKSRGFRAVLISATPFLHIKPSNIKGVGIKQNLSEFISQLKLAYSYQSLVWGEGIKQGSRFDMMRTFYYLAFPLIFLAWILNFLSPVFSNFHTTLLFVFYFFINLLYHLWKTKTINKLSIASSFYYLAIGISTSYGLIARLLKIQYAL